MTLEELANGIGLDIHWEMGEGGGCFTVLMDLQSGRSQRVTVREVGPESERWVRLTSGIGPSGLLGASVAKDVLERNFAMLHGAIAINGAELVMTEALPMSRLDVDRVRETLKFVAQIADRLEKELFVDDQS